MNKPEFIKRVAEELDLPQESKVGHSARSVSDAVFKVLEDGLAEGKDVSLGNLGKLKVVESPARKGHNPQTGEAMDIPARNRPRYTPSQHARDIVL